MEKKIYEITWGTLWRVAIMIAIATTIFAVRDVLVNIFLAVVISTGLNPFIDWFEKKGVPRILGTLFTYIVIFLLVGLVIYAVLPIAIVEFGGLMTNVVEIGGDFFSMSSAEEVLRGFNENFSSFGRSFIPSEFSLLGVLSGVFGGVAFVVTAVVISFYLSVSRDGVEWFLRAILPEKHEERFINIFRRSKRRIGYWLQTQILLSFIVGVLAFIGLWFLGVEHAFILGLTAGMFEIIPFVGPIFAGGIAVLVALSDSFSLGIYALVLFLAIQQIESQLIIPTLMNKAVGLHPVIILAAFMIGVKLLGFVGMILAVPVSVILQEALDDWISIKDHRKAVRKHLFSG